MKNKIFILLGVIVILNITAQAILLKYNVDSLCDEGFHFYSLKFASKGQVGGGSQYANIVTSLFFGQDVNNILVLRIIGFCLVFFTALLFASITVKHFAKTHYDRIGYFIMCFLMVVPSIGGIIVNYNHLFLFFGLTALALSYSVLTNHLKINILLCFCIGILLIFGLFCILPSSVLLILCLFVLLIVRYKQTPKVIIQYSVFTIIGMFCGVLLFNWAVADIGTVLASMSKTAQTVTTLNRGYDPFSFAIAIGLFFRDWFLMTLVVVGIFFISSVISHKSKEWIGGAFMIMSLIVYSFYQTKPQVTTAMLISSMWICLLYNKVNTLKWNNIFCFDTILNLFLALSPIILTIGTNVYIGSKMTRFILPWVLLLYRMDWHKDCSLTSKCTSIFVALTLCFGLSSFPQTIKEQSSIVQSGPLKGMHLTEKQAEHFELCDSIMNANGFDKNKSIVFTTQLSTMNNCYMDAISYANYFEPMDFVANPMKGKGIPDFLYLCEYDEVIAGEQLRKMGWGWPEDFEVFEVGTPETFEPGYPTERKLYCRKRIKKE